MVERIHVMQVISVEEIGCFVNLLFFMLRSATLIPSCTLINHGSTGMQSPCLRGGLVE